MQKIKIVFAAIILSLSVAINVFAIKENADSIILKEIVINSPKERPCISTSTSYSLSQSLIKSEEIRAVKNASLNVPNFYIPDYGSKITSSIYIRGIGSRMNEPSVGLYVDNIPYLDKSAFDFDFFDIASLNILQGPQGTLYGRNSIGGLIDINTLSPLTYQGTKLKAGLGNYGSQDYDISHYMKIGNSLGLSLGGYYKKDDGYFKNTFLNQKDMSENYGGRFKAEWKINNLWKAAISSEYSHSWQRAYPYAQIDSTGKTKDVSYNDNSGYLRDMLTNGLTFQRKGEKTLFTSATGYQFIKDKMTMDNDFTTDSMLYLTQKQKMNNLSQEFTLRSNNKSLYQWVTGAFGFYKDNDIEAPMLMESGMINKINTAMQAAMAAARLINPKTPTVTIINKELDIPGSYDMKSYGAALYHQSYVTLFKKLTLSAGLRANYEKTSIKYNASGTLNTTVKVASPYVPLIYADSTYAINGNVDKEFWEILPKFSAKYMLNSSTELYATATKGYKAGGYNYSMLSDILESEMQGESTSSDVESTIYYKPETLWSYEAGTRGNVLNNRLKYNVSMFIINDRNQQIATTTTNGTRIISNADKTRSYGVEAKIDAQILDQLSLTAAYGYTNAKFKDYEVDASTNYNGKYVPFVPKNTLSLGLNYIINSPNFIWKKTTLFAQYQALGKIYWDEANTYSQDFYGTLNGGISLERNNVSLNFWIKNALDEDYNTFYFKSLGNSFVQKGRPMTLGASISVEL